MGASGEPRRARVTFDRSVILSQLLFGVAFVVVIFTLQLFAPELVTSPLATAGAEFSATVSITFADGS